MRLEPLCSETLWLCLSPRVPLSSAPSLSLCLCLSSQAVRTGAFPRRAGRCGQGNPFSAVDTGVSELPRSWVFLLYFFPTVHSLGAKKLLKVEFKLTPRRLLPDSSGVAREDLSWQPAQQRSRLSGHS